jgi:hypothetical protein
MPGNDGRSGGRDLHRFTRRRPVGCVQMHGGIGVTWEHDLHVYLRRVALYRSMFGTPEEHNLRVYQWQEAGNSAPRSA